mgnify:FL=1
MKYALYMIMCSAIAGECMPPHQMDNKYNDMYSCLNAGYKESLAKSQEIGKQEINQHHIYLKFVCKEQEVIVPKPKPKVEA